MRARRSRFAFVLTIAALVSLTLVGTAGATRSHASSKVYASVDIDGIGYQRLEALKHAPGIEWWVELDRELLVCGAPEMLAAIGGGYAYREIHETIDPANLCILYGRGAEEAGVRVLAKGGRSAVVVATPAERRRLERMHAHGDVPHAHNVVAPFVPNVALAHQAANDAPRASKTSFDVSIQALVDSIDVNRWHDDVQTLGTFNRYTRGSGNLAARDWLVQQFQALPGMVVTTPSFNVPGGGGTTSYNVVATLTGTTRPNDWYIVGAHFDSISNNDNQATAPGCEDNGSGSAAVLEDGTDLLGPPARRDRALHLLLGRGAGSVRQHEPRVEPRDDR